MIQHIFLLDNIIDREIFTISQLIWYCWPARKFILNIYNFSSLSISKINSFRVVKEMHAETAAIVAQGLVKGGSLYNEILKRNPAWVDQIISTLEKELSEKYGKAPMIAPISAIITQGWK